MNKQSKILKILLSRIKETRTQKSITQENIEEALIIGPGWIDSFEKGDVSITLETLLAILKYLYVSLSDITENISVSNDQEFPRNIYAVKNDTGIDVRFKYAKHDAVYFLEKATVSEFNQVIKELRNGLAKLVSENEDQSEALKTEAVAQAFIKAVNFWPSANPSDIWWFIIYRAYCDPFNHPAKYSRLSFEQSWKRTGGWALEEILVRHYGPALLKKGIRLFIASTDERVRLLEQANVSDRLEADKADVLLTGKMKGKERKYFLEWYMSRLVLRKEELMMYQ
jgi:transcriptional regulator with XRE-family HTH domain